MKPTSSRAARRLTKKAAAGGPPTLASLDARITRAKIKGLSRPLEDRAKRILRSYLQTAQTYERNNKKMTIAPTNCFTSMWVV